jgi:CDP-diacylglycerol--glycerol-3-phosphate 3-phosphatidyltransferase/cardiolipin synthase
MTRTADLSTTNHPYRARDLLLAPGLLSLARVPLAAAFVCVASRPKAALVVLVLAGITDVLDGWLARKLAQATPTGALLDGIADKVFVAAVVGVLAFTGRLSLPGIAMLTTREVGELPLALWVASSAKRRHALAGHPTANAPGKLATLLQFAAVASSLVAAPITGGLLIATAATGAASAILYWAKTISTVDRA